MALRQRSDQPNPCLRRRSLFWRQRKASLREPRKRLRRGAPSALKIQNKLDEAVSETKSVQSRLAETQSRLEAAQSELESAKQQAEQAKAQVAELEQKGANLKLELQKGDGQRIELQAKLDEAGSEIERLKSELEKATRAESL